MDDLAGLLSRTPHLALISQQRSSLCVKRVLVYLLQACVRRAMQALDPLQHPTGGPKREAVVYTKGVGPSDHTTLPFSIV